jgi:hypothetical protein
MSKRKWRVRVSKILSLKNINKGRTVNAGTYQSDLRIAEALYENGELDSAKELLIRIAEKAPDLQEDFAGAAQYL